MLAHIMYKDGSVKMESYSRILLQNTLINIGISIFLIIAMLSFALGKTDVFSKRKVVFKSKSYKLFYTKVIPIILGLSIVYLNLSSIIDYIKPDLQTRWGTLNSMSYNSKNFKQFSVKIDNNIYRIPIGVKEPDVLIIGKKYEFVFTSRGKVIVKISQLN